MLRRFQSIFLFAFIAGCIEPFEFVIHEDEPSIVVEAFISDKSFNETLLYPSDGRYFTVKLSRTGDVTNLRPEPVSGAIVELTSSDGGEWIYHEDSTGFFRLTDKEFKAVPGVQYRLQILLPDETTYESAWQSLPESSVAPMGEIGFSETEQQMYEMVAGKWELKTIKGMMANISVPRNTAGEEILYRWSYSPTWIYKAPLSSVIDPGNKCWATDKNYLNTYELQTDRSGGYVKDLFFFRSIRNERIFEKFSVLVVQHVMDVNYFNFWKEMKDQNEGSKLNDVPPFNLQTNFRSTTDESKRVSGFFGVVQEQARRWYFSRQDLSYNVVNTLKADCLVDYGPGPPALECTDCRGYSFGVATTTKPHWWED